MTPNEVATLLTYASATDARVRRNDPEQRKAQVTAWSVQLRNVDAVAAREAVDRHYSRAGVDAVLPGDVRAGAAEHPSSRPLSEVIADLPPRTEFASLSKQASMAQMRRVIASVSAKLALPPGDDAAPAGQEAAG